MTIEKQIENLNQAVVYLAKWLDNHQETLDRINKIDTYNKSSYEHQNEVEVLLETE